MKMIEITQSDSKSRTIEFYNNKDQLEKYFKIFNGAIVESGIIKRDDKGNIIDEIYERKYEKFIQELYHYEYNDRNEVISFEKDANYDKDIFKTYYKYKYNDDGSKIAYEYNGNNTEHSIGTAVFDKEGKIISKDSQLKFTSFKYNELGKVESKESKWYSGVTNDFSILINTSYEYDNKGNLSSKTITFNDHRKPIIYKYKTLFEDKPIDYTCQFGNEVQLDKEISFIKERCSDCDKPILGKIIINE